MSAASAALVAGVTARLDVSADTLAEGDAQALEDELAGAMVVSALLGMDHVRRSAQAGEVEFADGIEIDGLEPLPFDEAVEALRGRVAMDAAEFAALDAAARTRAFTIARVTGADVLAEVRDALAKAIEAGTTGRERDKIIREALEAAGAGPLSPWLVETVARNNAQAAYSAGRWRQFRELGDAIEYLEYVAIGDERTTDLCNGYDGTILPADHDFWSYASPPNHHRCRSTIRAILRGTASAGRAVVTPDGTLEGFEAPPEGWAAAARDVDDLAAVPASVAERAEGYGIG